MLRTCFRLSISYCYDGLYETNPCALSSEPSTLGILKRTELVNNLIRIPKLLGHVAVRVIFEVTARVHDVTSFDIGVLGIGDFARALAFLEDVGFVFVDKPSSIAPCCG